ncbi:MAG: LytTR family transcriptional regulator DNA-binding domain-containing protein [Bacteroidales bacterium]|nr:LytTR family transcriptional regulator DNA-binding domain-containing protein [Bacteroidales bacterium]
MDNDKNLQKIGFKSQKCIRVAEIKNIIYCRADGPYTVVKLNGNYDIHISRPLKEMENELSEGDFFRINRQYLVNLNNIVEYSKNKNHKVIMNSGEELCISKRNICQFRKRFGEYVKMI